MYSGAQKTIFQCIAPILLCGLFAALPAKAQEEPRYLSEYKAYTQAMEDGDSEAATRHGYAAWQVAEEMLGDHKLTGILAFNYGQLVIFSNTGAAVVALRRAKELQDAGIVELPSNDLTLFLAYAEFESNRRRWRQANKLRDALEATEQAEVVTVETATMWLHLASSDFQSKRYKDAIASAGKAEQAYESASPDSIQPRANAIIIAGASKLIPFPRKLEDVVSAHTDFGRAIRLFSPQKDFESFDPIFAQALGWWVASDAAIVTLGKDHGEVIEAASSPVPPAFEISADAPEDCGAEWEAQKPPKYPRTASIGAVIAVFDLGDDVYVHNPRILSEVPVETFSKDVLKSMKKWKLKSPTVDHPNCRKNLITQFTFVMP